MFTPPSRCPQSSHLQSRVRVPVRLRLPLCQTDTFRLHNDIKPDNILVSEQNGDSAYDVSFKLIDLGLTGFVLAGDFDETQMRDVHGTKVYSRFSL